LQGYKHDGITRTPNTTWIDPIDEDSDWTAANDPCRAELGDGWRIPSQYEWSNVINGGFWYDWNGPWNSALKLHSAGSLSTNGSLEYRGVGGIYWSNLQGSTNTAWYIRFNSFECPLKGNYKSIANTVRCIHD